MKNYLYGTLCGALVVSAILFWAAPKKVVNAAVLPSPAEGRFQLVQFHPNSGSEWSGILDTETGCLWEYTSQTPPTDAEAAAAPAGEQRSYKSYQQALGYNYLFIIGYDDNGPAMTLPGQEKPSTLAGAQFSTLAAEEFYCNQARQNAIRAVIVR